MTEEELKNIEGVIVTAKRLGWNIKHPEEQFVAWKDSGLDENVCGILSILWNFNGVHFFIVAGSELVDPDTIAVAG